MLGVETPGLYEASPPRRRSESLKATEAMAIAEAAAAAAVSARTRQGTDAMLREDAAAAAAELAALENLEEAEGGRADVVGRERDNLLQIAGAARYWFDQTCALISGCVSGGAKCFDLLGCVGNLSVRS